MTIPDPVVLRPEGVVPIALDPVLLVATAFYGLVLVGFRSERIRRVQYLAWACGLPMAGLSLFLVIAVPEDYLPGNLFMSLAALALFGLTAPDIWRGGIPTPPPAGKTPPGPPK